MMPGQVAEAEEVEERLLGMMWVSLKLAVAWGASCQLEVVVWAWKWQFRAWNV